MTTFVERQYGGSMPTNRNRYQVPTRAGTERGGRAFGKYASAVAFAARQAAEYGRDWSVRRYSASSYSLGALLFSVRYDGTIVPKENRPVVTHAPAVIFGGKLSCPACGFDDFRYLGRTLDYNNYQCLDCGKLLDTLTETGASR